ncbi:MAG TPA: ABC transporter permease [Candidatus Polarisedimenticolaceae bacterium]|nr:ABC transporter permease [Candidatus Polarisedimenticolaceae bacterium]
MRRWLEIFRRGFWENVRFALEAIREHKLRAGLTTLGIVVGVTTVMGMVAIVAGFNNNVIGNLQKFGANRIEFKKYDESFNSGNSDYEEQKKRHNLTMDDAAALRAAVPEAAAVSGLCGQTDAVLHIKHGNLEANLPYVLGVDEYYPQGTSYDVGHGRFFTSSEIAHSAPMAIVGADVKDAIFPLEDPLGKDITVDGMHYLVIGVLARKGEQFGWSPDNKVVLPFGTFKRQFPYRVLEDGVNLSVVPRRTEDLQLVVDKCISVLRQRRKVPFNKPNDFGVSTPDQLIGQFKQITGGITGAMVFIAGLSLLIGGVGVMNIMLVSVTERTREIGVRKALGALRRDIVGQFLTEAVTLSCLGGLIGVAIGIGIASFIKANVSALPAEIPLWSPIVGLAVSMGVGIFFGAYPAVKASRLDPIESLRYE